jgi:hypothetical protein
VDFTSKLPRGLARTGYVDDYFFVAQWFPKIGVYESAAERAHHYGLTTPPPQDEEPVLAGTKHDWSGDEDAIAKIKYIASDQQVSVTEAERRYVKSLG